MKRLGDLNVFKSPGLDMLHPRVLKEVREAYIAPPLQIIFEASFILGDSVLLNSALTTDSMVLVKLWPRYC